MTANRARTERKSAANISAAAGLVALSVILCCPQTSWSQSLKYQAPSEDKSATPQAQPGQTGTGPFILKGGVIYKSPAEALQAIKQAVTDLKSEAKSLYKECTKKNYIEPSAPMITGGWGFVIVDQPDMEYDPETLPPDERKVHIAVKKMDALAATLGQAVSELKLPKDADGKLSPTGQNIDQAMQDVVQLQANLHGIVNAYDLNVKMIVRNSSRMLEDSRYIQKQIKDAEIVLAAQPAPGSGTDEPSNPGLAEKPLTATETPLPPAKGQPTFQTDNSPVPTLPMMYPGRR